MNELFRFSKNIDQYTESCSECDAADVGNLIVTYVNVRQHIISLQKHNQTKNII